jgi:ABC-type transporter Mla subunit MlaD
MSALRRILGVILILVGLVGLVIAGSIAFFGGQAVDAVGASLNSTLTVVSSTVDTTTETLRAVQGTIDEAAAAIDTVSSTATNLSKTLVDSTPLLQQVTTLATDTVPTSLDAVQQTVPNLANIAGTIDTTLQRLADLQVERSILGVPVSFDLGVTYRPAEPFDEAVLKIGDSLVGVPDQLRELQGGLQTVTNNLGSIGENVSALSTNLDGIYTSVGQFNPLVDQYIGTLEQTNATLKATQEQFNASLATIKLVLVGLGVWFALYQILPLYFGWRMVRDKDPEDAAREAVAEFMAQNKSSVSATAEGVAAEAEAAAGKLA